MSATAYILICFILMQLQDVPYSSHKGEFNLVKIELKTCSQTLPLLVVVIERKELCFVIIYFYQNYATS